MSLRSCVYSFRWIFSSATGPGKAFSSHRTRNWGRTICRIPGRKTSPCASMACLKYDLVQMCFRDGLVKKVLVGCSLAVAEKMKITFSDPSWRPWTKTEQSRIFMLPFLENQNRKSTSKIWCSLKQSSSTRTSFKTTGKSPMQTAMEDTWVGLSLFVEMALPWRKMCKRAWCEF